MTDTTERTAILQRIDVLRRILPKLEERLGPARFTALGDALAPWLERLERASTEDELRELARQLRMLETQLNIRQILDRESQQSILGAKLGPDRGPHRGPDRPSQGPGDLSVLERVRQLLHLDRPVALSVYPALRTPDEVCINTAFDVHVTAHREARPGSAPPVILTRRHPGHVDLEVELVLPPDDAVEARTYTQQPLRIPEEGAPMELRFELIPRRLGGHRIEAVFRRDGVEVDRLAATVLVRPPEEMVVGTQSVVDGRFVSSLGGAAHPLVLRIEHRASANGRRFDRVSLVGGGRFFTPIDARRELLRNPLPLLVDLCRQIGNLKEDAARSRELSLRAIGQRLAAELLPGAVLASLDPADFKAGTPLHIESDDAWAPWELAWLGSLHDGVFLGEHFAVTRRLHEGGQIDLIADREAALVWPGRVRPKLDATREREALRALRGGRAPAELRTMQETQELLAGAVRYGVLHFACHGAARPDEALGGILPLDGGELRESHVPALDPVRHDGPLAGALVFLNACEVGMDGMGLTGHGGWARTFLKAGAGAFVAPSWAVGNAPAITFATRFYAALLDGHTLGEAARLARLAARVEGNASWLGYAVYASPHARYHRST